MCTHGNTCAVKKNSFAAAFYPLRTWTHRARPPVSVPDTHTLIWPVMLQQLPLPPHPHHPTLPLYLPTTALILSFLWPCASPDFGETRVRASSDCGVRPGGLSPESTSAPAASKIAPSLGATLLATKCASHVLPGNEKSPPFTCVCPTFSQ